MDMGEAASIANDKDALKRHEGDYEEDYIPRQRQGCTWTYGRLSW